MAGRKPPPGQRRAAKVAARRRRGGRSTPAPQLRPILTLPGLDGYGPADLPDDRTDGVPELRLALAQSRAGAELGYRIPPVADPADYPPERLVEWAATVGRHHTAIVDADVDEDSCVTELVGHRMGAAVDATFAEATPDRAREEVAVLLAVDGGRPRRALRLAAEVVTARLTGADRAGALAWVRAALGPQAATAASAAPGVADVDADTLTALLWLAAGASAASHGVGRG